MRRKGLLACTTIILFALLALPTFSALAWDGGIDKDISCDAVTVTASPETWFEDHSGSSQIKWEPVPPYAGTGTFAWGELQTSMNGSVTVTWRKYTSNNGGDTWTATSTYHTENFNWSANRPGSCKITICHVSGSAADPANYNTLNISINAALGHFYENGTPKAGHENDSLGACNPPPPPVPGCTDVNASNYDPEATVDDGSCQYPPPPVPGCTDPQALNYNSEATEDDGSCQYPPPPVPGCTDEAATNYNSEATEDDGSCQYPPEEIPGCMDQNATNYDPEATVDDGSCEFPPPPPVPGCTDQAATNYNPDATVDDGSCEYPPPPPETCQYNPDIPADDPECQPPPPETCQYDPQIPPDDPNCKPPEEPTPPPTHHRRHPHKEPETGPEGALPIGAGLTFLVFTGIGVGGIKRMLRK